MLRYRHKETNHLFHEWISRVFLRSLQFGFVVLGFLDLLSMLNKNTVLTPENLEILLIA